MKTKIITLILCISLLVTSMCAPVGASGTDFSMELLNKMGVLQGDPDGNMRPHDLVTRAEFAKLAVLLSSYRSKVSSVGMVSVFADCTASHWASPYVKVAAENGIIRGYSDGRFGPDDHITYTQAITVALRLLGYSDEDFGNSYPSGQLGAALSVGLGDNLTCGVDDALSRREVSTVLENMLSAFTKGTNREYITDLGYRLIDDCIVIADNSGDAAVAPGKVFTSEGTFNLPVGGAQAYIGKKGRALIGEDNTLIALFSGDVTSVQYTVYSAAAELVSVYDGSSQLSFDCDDLTLCYRGTQKTDYASLRPTLTTGEVLTVGMRTDGTIDYVIAGSSDFAGPYTLEADGALPVGIDADGVSVLKNGLSSAVAELKKYDIIYYSELLSTVFAYDQKVNGIYISASPNTDAPKSVNVGGREFQIESPAAFAALCSGGTYVPGNRVTLLLGRDGSVADVMSTDVSGSSQAEPDFDEISVPQTSKAQALLYALDAMYTSSADAILTRGELARMAVMISPYRGYVSPGYGFSVFPDCLHTNPLTPYIKICAENKLMSAASDGYFYPDNGVTLARAVDVCLKILGYTDGDFSAWSSGQIATADSVGMLKDISASPQDYITCDTAATLLYNTLNADLKSGTSKAVEAIGYQYYTDAVIIADSSDNASVPQGKILTSEGAFEMGAGISSATHKGNCGGLAVYSGRVVSFTPDPGYVAGGVIYSAVSGGLAVKGKNGVESIAVSDSTPVYKDGKTTSYSAVKNSVAMGDEVQIFCDSAMRLKYIFLTAGKIIGPAVALSASVPHQLGAPGDSRILKNGRESTGADITPGDVVYYIPALETVYVYNQKVTGIYESASPTAEAPDSITVSGTTYKPEVAGVMSGGYTYGQTVTLTLGRDGKVVAIKDSADQSLTGYLTQSGIKDFKTATGENYTAYYASLVLPDGSTIECITNAVYDNLINSVVTLIFEDDVARPAKASSNGVSGSFDADKLTLGNSRVDSGVKILDIGYTDSNYPTIYTTVFPSRLDGVTLSSSEVLYCREENGVITELILKDVTGDVYQYGIVTAATTNIGKNTASGSYTCNFGGSSASYSGGAYTNIKKGTLVKGAVEGGRIEMLYALYHTDVKITACDYNTITLADGSVLQLADSVSVYRINTSKGNTLIPLSEFCQNLSSYGEFSICTDGKERSGGRVRIITVR